MLSDQAKSYQGTLVFEYPMSLHGDTQAIPPWEIKEPGTPNELFVYYTEPKKEHTVQMLCNDLEHATIKFNGLAKALYAKSVKDISLFEYPDQKVND